LSSAFSPTLIYDGQFNGWFLDQNGERQGAVGRVAGFGAFGADGRCGTSILVDGPVLFRLSEAYWAPITTLVITQSSLGAALTVSWQWFIGTVLGVAVGAIAASYFEPHLLVFASSVFILGLLCAVLRVEQAAYRFGE
jgi:hypothetical protein